MKRQKKSIIIGIVIAVTAVTAAAAGTYGTLSQPQKQQPGVQLTAQRSAAVGEMNDPIYTYIASTYSGDERYEKAENYAVVKTIYQPTEEEIQYMAELLYQGSKLDVVLETYQFWMTTNEPLERLGEIVAAWMPEDEDVMYWIDDVYNLLTENEDVLTKEEIEDYVARGIQPEDIAVADELSRKKVLSIRKILQQREKGDSWIAIVNQIYQGIQIQLELSAQNLEDYQNVKGYDVLRAVVLRGRGGRSLQEWLELCLGEEPRFSEEAVAFQTQVLAEELDYLRTVGLYGETQELQEERISEREYVSQQLQTYGVSEEEIQELQEQGYDSTELINAAVEAQQSGLSLVQQLAE